jgi:hypothetical protein
VLEPVRQHVAVPQQEPVRVRELVERLGRLEGTTESRRARGSAPLALQAIPTQGLGSERTGGHDLIHLTQRRARGEFYPYGRLSPARAGLFVWQRMLGLFRLVFGFDNWL